MSRVRRLVRRFAAFLRPGAAETELTREVSAHRHLYEDDLLRQGLTAAEARLAADRAFLGIEAAKDAHRDTRSFAALEDARRDVRHAVRLLARDSGFALAVVVTLGLGVGVATAVFSLVDAVVLRPLDYDRPDALVQLYETGKREGGEADWVAFPNFRDWRSGSRVFEEMAAYRFGFVSMTGGAQPEGAVALEVTDRLFAVLGVPPLRGRTFVPGEDHPERARVTVISHALWLRQFAGHPSAEGRSLIVDGVAHTIVGVMPASFAFPAVIPGDNVIPIDVWLPMRPHDLDHRGSHNFWAIARLKDGVGLERARAEMATIADRLAREYPETNRGFRVAVQPLKVHVAGAARPALLSLLGAVGFVLLLTCANIATLLLSRAEARRREMAMREALGASRGRLVRQTLAESLVLAFGGAIAGLGVAYAGTRVLVSLAPAAIPRLEQAAVDARVLGFMAATTALVGILFGLAPAVFGSSGDVTDALKDSGTRVTGGAAARRVRHTLVAAQLALAVVLLVGAGLLVRSFVRVAGLDLGFHAPHVLTAMINLSPDRYGEAPRQVGFTDDVLRRVGSLPGVQAAGVSHSLPLTGINDQGGFVIEGRPDPPPGQGPHANRPRVSPGYFAVMGIRSIEGRLIDERDRSDTLPVAVISDVAARTYWPGQNAIGRRLAIEWVDGRPAWRQIVGVVQGTRHFGPEAPQKAEIYLPIAQSPVPYMTLVVRTAGDPLSLVPAVRSQIAAIDPEQGVFWFQTMDDVVARSSARRRFQMALVATFAGLALLLAAVGVYGVMGYTVAQRRREIGVRLALGAKPRDVIAMVLGHSLWLTLAGAAVGLAGALALSRVLAGFVFGISPLDPGTYAAALAVLISVALLSAYRPSRSAARVDPLVVLRDE